MHANALTLNLAHSRLLIAALAAVHVCAGAAVVLADLGWAYRLPCLVALAIGLIVSARPTAALHVRGHGDGSLAVRVGEDWRSARLLPDTVVLPWLVVLRYSQDDGRGAATRIVLPDSLGADEFRRLRVWLRWRSEVARSGRRPA